MSVLRGLTFDGETFNIFTHSDATHLRLDGLSFGVLLAYGYHHHREAFLAFAERNRSRLLLYGILGLLPPFFLPLASWYVRVPGFTIQWLASGSLLVAALAWHPKENALQRALAACGRRSQRFTFFIIGSAPWASRPLSRASGFR